MQKLLALLALGAVALYFLEETGTVQISSGGGTSSGAIGGYLGASGKAIAGAGG
jgi:hypothetical protein